MRIVPADFADPRVVAVLRQHQTRAIAETARGSAHALDLAGLSTPDVVVWASWDADDVVGVIGLRRFGDHRAEIKSMYVVESTRRRGIGSMLVQHVISAARGSGLTQLCLETGSWNYFAPAKKLYLRHGFVECGPFGDYIKDPNSVFMSLTLIDDCSSARW